MLQRAEATFEPLPFDAEAARVFGLVSAAVLAAGALFTTSPDDFTGLEDLLSVVPVPRP